jgi:hypothetical protein
MARAKRPRHEIQAIDSCRRGWRARCVCGEAMPRRRDEEAANADAVRHMLREVYGLDVRAARRVISGAGEIDALLSTLASAA